MSHSTPTGAAGRPDYWMHRSQRTNERLLETMLVLITVALACVMYFTSSMKIVVLNLFFLPVVLAGFFMGRYRAGILALLSVIAATVVSVSDVSHFGGFQSPVTVVLSIILWGAVLGLTSLLVGTLCDERDAKALEVHEGHVGVVEVLSRYLQSANPNLEFRAKQMARLSEEVAREMRLSAKEIDDIRMASLLIDMENIEITARVIRKAVGELEGANGPDQRTFCGTELVRSLGSVLSGAFPLLLSQSQAEGAGLAGSGETPFGAKIIHTVRAYVKLLNDPWECGERTPQEVVEELRSDLDSQYHPAVLHALDRVVATSPAGTSAAAFALSQELAQL